MIKSKDQVLDCFQKFHMAVEQETWLSLRAVCSNNGGKYTDPFKCCRKHKAFEDSSEDTSAE